LAGGLLAVCVLVVGIGVVSQLRAAPSVPPADSIGRLGAGGTGSASPVASQIRAPSQPARPAPTPNLPASIVGIDGLTVVRGQGDGRSLLALTLGGACLKKYADTTALVKVSEQIDKILVAGKVRDGMVTLGDGHVVWVGADMLDAARRFGASAIAIGGQSDPWVSVGQPPKVIVGPLRNARTPAGRMFWWAAGGYGVQSCRSVSPAP
jgi:hypothetical protein